MSAYATPMADPALSAVAANRAKMKRLTTHLPFTMSRRAHRGAGDYRALEQNEQIGLGECAGIPPGAQTSSRA